MVLREYQKEAVEAVLSGFGEFRRQLLVAPTGSGKTIMFSAMADKTMQAGKRTLILAHREELIQQAVDKLRMATGIVAEVEKAERKAGYTSPVVVGSVQTLARENRLHLWPKSHFGLVVVDEAHHTLADSYLRVLTHFDSNVIGVTATPDRGDKRLLSSFYENVAYEISLRKLIKGNPQYLSNIVIKTLPLRIDLTGVGMSHGDFAEGDLDCALTPYLGAIASAMREHASFRKSLVFLPLIATSKAFCAALRKEGFAAEHVDGDSQDRAEILRRFSENKIDVLCNAMLLTEGYDEPSVDCVVVLRPTRSRPLYSQMVGRGTRMADGKENLLLLDFLWMHERHSLVHPANLIAQDEDTADRMTKAAGNGDEVGLFEVEETVQQQREAALREQLERQAKRKASTMDALDFCLSVHSPELTEYEPTMTWEKQPITEGQKQFLLKLRIDPESVKSKGHASKIIGTIIDRRKAGLATPKQVLWLRRLGYSRPEDATFDQATAFLNSRFNRTA